MARKDSVVVLFAEERAQLGKIRNRLTSERRLVFRAKIILALSQGLNVQEISQKLNVPPKTIIKWKKRYLSHQLDERCPASWQTREVYSLLM